MARTTILLTAVVLQLAQAQTMHPVCLAQHCGGQFLEAMLQPTFMQNSLCEMGCTKVYDQDPTPEKLQYQNCTTTCAVTYESGAGDAFLACAMDNGCVEFPPIPGSCPYTKEHIQPSASLASLSGEFWQHRGKNALWDCYPCQHIHSMYQSNDSAFCAKTVFPATGPVQAPCWAYTYSYDLYQTDGSTKTFEQTWQLPGDVPAGEPIDIYYNYMGSWHNETWYILREDANYVLLGDCSYMMDWVDVGSIVWVRPGHVLTEAENAEIRAEYKNKLGWDYDDFCYDTHGPENCREPSLSEPSPLPRRFRHATPGQRRPLFPPEQMEEVKQLLAASTV